MLILGSLVLAIIGALLTAYAWPFYRKVALFLRQAMAVEIKVAELKVEEDDESRVVSPVFTIIGGQYAGHTRVSQFGSWPSAYSVGEVWPGLFDPASGKIERSASVRKARAVAASGVVVGIALMLPCLFLAVQRLM